MTQVKLMGELGDLFGTDWQCSENAFDDIIKLIDCQTEGFTKKIQEYVEKGIGLEVVDGKRVLAETEEDIDELFLPVIKDTLFITPVPVGSKKKKRSTSIFKIIAGIALMVLAGPAAAALMNVPGATSVMVGAETITTAATLGKGYFLTKYALIAAGGLLALKGITEILTPDTFDSPESKLFGGENSNNIVQGAPVPLCYGEMIVPGVPINFGFMDRRTQGNSYVNPGPNGDESDPVNDTR